MDNNKEKIEALASDVINISRNTLVFNLRFMDKAISMLTFESVPGFSGYAVDGKTVFYDPVHVLKSFSEDRKSVTRQYLHMVFHGVYQHFWISTLVNRDCWDLACDIAVEYTINGIEISALETELSEKQLSEMQKLRPKVKYMTADVLYRYFLDTDISEKEIARLKEIFSVDDHSIWYLRSGKQQENESATGNDDDTSPGNGITNGATSDLSAEWQAIARQMKMDIETFSREKSWGSDPLGLTQNLLAVTREKYDYSAFLKKFATLGERMKINDDEFDYIFYTYGLKLYEKMPLIEPLEYKDVKQVREFVIAIDTSGSTSGELVQTFVQKTYNILKQEESFSTRFNLHIIQCDAKIQEDVKITNQREFDSYLKHMKILGGGGTDFRPVFSYVDRLIENHEFRNLKGMIYFTDGFGTFPSKQPGYNVAVVYVEEGYENSEVPVWAIKLVLKPEDIKGI